MAETKNFLDLSGVSLLWSKIKLALTNKVDKVDGTLYYVQVGAFKNKDNAIALQKKLIKDGYKAIIK